MRTSFFSLPIIIGIAALLWFGAQAADVLREYPRVQNADSLPGELLRIGPVSDNPPPIYWIQTRMSQVQARKTKGMLHRYAPVPWDQVTGRWVLMVMAHQGEFDRKFLTDEELRRLGYWTQFVRAEFRARFGAMAEVWFVELGEVSNPVAGIGSNALLHGCGRTGSSWCMDRFLISQVAGDADYADGQWASVPAWLMQVVHPQLELDDVEAARAMLNRSMSPCLLAVDPSGVLWALDDRTASCIGDRGVQQVSDRIEELAKRWERTQ
ncbi:hypothetical protein JN531_017055 (plasmid) [Flagellatimonas centrodinii]|uniref:hypothetical protein n=1 Tax=Flagellatimonas centrodinii TaxID=2806210 RepID=UPI001FF02E74|nr:hypothetical protein [Flagellatimonas centrodinii]ULQ48342.1 hypothetical protein JN531_017055 [Flagellatimonas centrodinii]